MNVVIGRRGTKLGSWLSFTIILLVHACHGLRARIVNGFKAQLGEFPYQAGIQVTNITVCGGVIIDQYHVLTAAHCIEKYRMDMDDPETTVFDMIQYYSVLVGTIDQNDANNPGIWHNVNGIDIHEKFKWGDGWPNDIAMLKLEKPIIFNNNVQPALLPKPGEKLNIGQPAVISGFGRFTLRTNTSAVLYKTEVFIEENDKCQSYYHETIRPTNVCTRPTRVTGTCEGDSGGPITVDGKVVGLASFSLDNGCAGESMRPQVHTRVSEYIDWIDFHRR